MAPGRSSDQELDKLLKVTRRADAAGAMAEAVVEAERDYGHLVVLSRQPSAPSTPAIEALANAMMLDVYTARQRLSTPVPRPLRREATESAAAKWIEWLRASGIRCFPVAERELAAQQFPLHRAIYQEQDGMLFEDLAGERVAHGRAEVACIVAGEVTESTSGEKLQTSVVGQITGGLQPLTRRTEFVIDLQLRTATVAIRLTQDAFQYSTLFPGEAGSSAVLIRSVLKMIRKALPAAPVYEDFAIAENILGQSADQLVITNGPSSSPSLLSLRSHSEKNVLVQKSTLPVFDLYSSLARHDAMHAQ